MGEPPWVGRAAFGEGGGCRTCLREGPTDPQCHSGQRRPAQSHRGRQAQMDAQLGGRSWHPALHPWGDATQALPGAARSTPSSIAPPAPDPRCYPGTARAPQGGRGASVCPSLPLPSWPLWVVCAGSRSLPGMVALGTDVSCELRPAKALPPALSPPTNEDTVNWGPLPAPLCLTGPPGETATGGRQRGDSHVPVPRQDGGSGARRLMPARRSPVYLGPDHKQGTRRPRRVSHPGTSPPLHPHRAGTWHRWVTPPSWDGGTRPSGGTPKGQVRGSLGARGPAPQPAQPPAGQEMLCKGGTFNKNK